MQIEELKRPQILHPKATAYFFRPGTYLPARNGSESDQGLKLSVDGMTQARFMGKLLRTNEVCIDMAIVASTERARRTALEALHEYGGTPPYKGKGRELYGPAGDDEFKKLQTVLREFMAHRKISLPVTENLQLDLDILLVQFMEETRQVVRSIPSIENARRVVIFCDPLWNTVASALFPQHAAVLETIQLGICDCIKITATTCQHHIPLHVPDSA